MPEPVIPTMEDVRSAFGLGDPTPTPEPPAPAEPPVPPVTTEPPVEPPTEPNEPPAEPPAEPPEDPLTVLSKTKDAHAFAELRIQSSKQQQTIKSVAEILGLDVKALDNDALIAAVKDLTIQAKAKSTGIDSTILQSLEQFEALQEQQLRNTRYLEAQTQVSELQKKYEVPEEELMEFVKKLGEDKPDFDPARDTLDFEAEYLKRYTLKISERQVAKALAAEAARAAANQQAPGQPPGNGSGTPTQQPINTVKGLDQLLNSLADKL